MGTRSELSRAAQRRIIFLLIVYLHLVASQRSDDEATAEASPCPPSSPPLPYSSLNSCPNNNRILQLLDAISCTPSSAAPPPPLHDGGDQHRVPDMMGDRELSTAVVLALLTSRKDEGTQWEIMFVVIFPWAVCALLFCENPLRNMCPRSAQVLEQLLVISVVNGLMSFLLPAECLWVPAVCFGSSLLTVVVAPWLP